MKGRKALLVLGMLVLGVALAVCCSDTASGGDGITAPVPIEGLTYSGEAQELVEGGSVDGGTMEYSSNGLDFSTSIPKGTDATDYPIYYRAVGSLDTAGFVTGTIAKADIIYTPPAAVSGLSYDGDAHDLVTATSPLLGTMSFSVSYNDGEKSAYGTDIPKGTNPGTYKVYYKITATDSNYNDVSETGPIAVQISKANPIITAPSAISGLEYTTSSQNLITEGTVQTGTTITYRCQYGDISTQYSGNIPTGTNAGLYKIYYKVTGNEYYYDVSETGPIEVTIDKIMPTVTAPVGKDDQTYTGSELSLVNAGETTTGTTMEYRYVFNGTSSDYSTTVPKGINAGTYNVYYKVNGGSNYISISEGDPITVQIGKATPAADHFTCTHPTAPIYDGTEKTSDIALKTAYSGAGAITIHYSPDNINAGEVTVTIDVAAGDNFDAKTGIGMGGFTIQKATPTITPPVAKTDLVYTGLPQALIFPGNTTHGEMQYTLTPGEGYSRDIPTGTTAGTYNVYYKVIGSQNYDGKDETGPIAVVIEKQEQHPTMADVTFTYGQSRSVSVTGFTEVPESSTIRYSVVSGYGVSVNLSSGSLEWLNAGETTVKAEYGETASYKAGSVTCTVTTNKANPSYSQPQAKDLTYSGVAQELVTNGGGPAEAPVLYSLRSGSGFSQDVSTGTDAKEYTVYYRIDGGKYYNDVAEKSVKVTIKQATLPTVPQKKVTYNGDVAFYQEDFETGVHNETIDLAYVASSYNADTYKLDSSTKKFTITYGGTQNYKFGTVNDLIIEKATLSPAEKKVEYKGSTIFKEENYSTGVALDKVTLTYTAYSSNAGTYEYNPSAAPGKFMLTVTGSQNYKLDNVGKLIIEQAALPKVDVKTVTYNGDSVFKTENFSTGVNNEKVTLTYTAYTPDAGTYIKADSLGSNKYTIEYSGTQNYKFGTVGALIIEKATPKAEDFKFDQPADLVYNGTSKSVVVSKTSGIVGMGSITKTSYSDNVNVGTCDVKITLGVGENYTAATDLKVGSFTITKAVNTVSDPVIKGWSEGETPATPSGSVAKFGTPYYMYSTQSSENYTKTVPTAVGHYYVKAFVDATVNYDAVKSNAVSFEIKKAGDKFTPTKQNFVFTPTSFVYDGNQKTVTVTVASGVTGMGSITKTYYSDNVNIGKCTVKIDVAEGDSYKAVSGLEIGTFEITSTQKSDNTMLYIVIAALVVIGVVFVAYIMTNSRRR